MSEIRKPVSKMSAEVKEWVPASVRAAAEAGSTGNVESGVKVAVQINHFPAPKEATNFALESEPVKKEAFNPSIRLWSPNPEVKDNDFAMPTKITMNSFAAHNILKDTMYKGPLAINVMAEIPTGEPIYYVGPDGGKIQFLFGDKPQEFFGHEACLIRNNNMDGMYAIRTIADMPLSQILKHKLMFEGSRSLKDRNFDYYRNGPYVNEREVGINCGTCVNIQSVGSSMRKSRPNGLGISGFPITMSQGAQTGSTVTGTPASSILAGTPLTGITVQTMASTPPGTSPFSFNTRYRGQKDASVRGSPQLSDGSSSCPGSAGQMQFLKSLSGQSAFGGQWVGGAESPFMAMSFDSAIEEARGSVDLEDLRRSINTLQASNSSPAPAQCSRDLFRGHSIFGTNNMQLQAHSVSCGQTVSEVASGSTALVPVSKSNTSLGNFIPITPARRQNNVPQQQLMPRHLNKKTNALYKTEMCRNWAEIGECRYGRSCQFAHGKREMRTVPRHGQWKTKTCLAWLNGGCTYGSRCCYAHEVLDDVTNTADNGNSSPASVARSSTAQGVSRFREFFASRCWN